MTHGIATSILGKFPKGITEDDAWKVIEAAAEVFVGATSLAIKIDGKPPYLVVHGHHAELYDLISLEPREFQLSPDEIKSILREREEGKWRIDTPRGPFDL